MEEIFLLRWCYTNQPWCEPTRTNGKEQIANFMDTKQKNRANNTVMRNEQKSDKWKVVGKNKSNARLGSKASPHARGEVTDHEKCVASL